MESDYQVGEAARKAKKELRAPCSYTVFDERLQKNVETYPAVLCHRECDRCGWNPEVGKRRIQALLERRAKEGRKL